MNKCLSVDKKGEAGPWGVLLVKKNAELRGISSNFAKSIVVYVTLMAGKFKGRVDMKRAGKEYIVQEAFCGPAISQSELQTTCSTAHDRLM